MDAPKSLQIVLIYSTRMYYNFLYIPKHCKGRKVVSQNSDIHFWPKNWILEIVSLANAEIMNMISNLYLAKNDIVFMKKLGSLIRNQSGTSFEYS